MSTDILFDVTEKKKPKSKAKGKSILKSSGLSTKTKNHASIDIFGDAAPLPPQKSNSIQSLSEQKSKKHSKPNNITINDPESLDLDALSPDERVNALLTSYSDVKPYILLRPVTDITLTHAQVLEKVRDSAAQGYACLGGPGSLIAAKLTELDERYNELVKDSSLADPPPFKQTAKIPKSRSKKAISVKLPPNATIDQRAELALVNLLPFELNALLQQHGEKIRTIIAHIGVLSNNISKNPGTKELCVNATKIESDLNEFATNNPKYLRIQHFLDHSRYQVGRISVQIPSLPAIISKSRTIFDSTSSYFPDFGSPQAEFQTLLDLQPPEDIVVFRKRVNLVLKKPELAGKQILIASTTLAKKYELPEEDSTQFLFLLFARSFFSQMYSLSFGNVNSVENLIKISAEIGEEIRAAQSLGNQMAQIDTSLFAEKRRILLGITPIGFGFLDNFLEDPMYRSLPISAFPKEGGIYKQAISILQTLPFYTCPIDFCHAVDCALREIQNQASKNSFEKLFKAGKVTAKSEHLLCLDDLFDISLIVFLLSDPVAVFPLVKVFEPFIAGLEMPSELEFAFTNISAMVKHIEELDIDAFLEGAKKRTAASMEIDPLNIL